MDDAIEIAQKYIQSSDANVSPQQTRRLGCYILTLSKLLTKDDYMMNKTILNYLGMTKPEKKNFIDVIPFDKPSSKCVSLYIHLLLEEYYEKFVFGNEFDTLVNKMLNDGYTKKLARVYCVVSFFLSEFTEDQLNLYLTYLGRNKGYKGKRQLEYAIENDMKDYIEQKGKLKIPKQKCHVDAFVYLRLPLNLIHKSMHEVSVCEKYLHITPAFPRTENDFVTFPFDVYGRTKNYVDFLKERYTGYDGKLHDFNKYHIQFLHSMMSSSGKSLFFIYRTIQDVISRKTMFEFSSIFEDIFESINVGLPDIMRAYDTICTFLISIFELIYNDSESDIEAIKKWFPISDTQEQNNKEKCRYMNTILNCSFVANEYLLDEECLDRISMYILENDLFNQDVKDIQDHMHSKLDNIRKTQKNEIQVLLKKKMLEYNHVENDTKGLFDKNLVGEVLRHRDDELRMVYIRLYSNYRENMIPSFFPLQELKSEFKEFGENIDDKNVSYITGLFEGFDIVSKIKMNLYALVTYCTDPLFCGLCIYTGREKRGDEKEDKNELLYSEHIREGEINCPGSESIIIDSKTYTKKVTLTKRKNIILHQFIKNIRKWMIINISEYNKKISLMFEDMD